MKSTIDPILFLLVVFAAGAIAGYLVRDQISRYRWRRDHSRNF